MKITYFLTFFIALSILIASCDEINKIINPTSEYLVDKTVRASSTEQIIESGNDIKIIIPANSLSGDLGLKIKKEGSIPTFSVSNTKLGSNVYKISFTGNTAFSSPIKVTINYDKSQIPAGKTVAEIVKGYVYANSNWKIGSYIIDETNSKIIFSVSNLATPKINKDIPELLTDGDVTFGDGYNTTDTGQGDNPLAKYKFLNVQIGATVGWDIKPNNSLWDFEGPNIFGTYDRLDKNRQKIVWNGNYFSVSIKQGNSVQYFSGEAKEIGKDKENGYITIVKLSQEFTRIEDGIITMKNSYVLENFKIKLPKNLATQSCLIDVNCSTNSAEVAKYVTDFKVYFYCFDKYTTPESQWASNSTSYFFGNNDKFLVEFSPF